MTPETKEAYTRRMTDVCNQINEIFDGLEIGDCSLILTRLLAWSICKSSIGNEHQEKQIAFFTKLLTQEIAKIERKGRDPKKVFN
jgi:hypothetical protein